MFGNSVITRQMAPMVLAVSNAVAKDALCVNDMECCGKCVLFTLTGAERRLQNILNIYVSQSVDSVLYIVSTKLSVLH